jgi:DNA replication ATP-dependent helicase Dna2
MQGQERDLIILSLTTSSPDYAIQLRDFFFQPERLNVAITRPRCKLIIVGSRHTFSITVEDPSLQASLDLFQDLLASCHVVEAA